MKLRAGSAGNFWLGVSISRQTTVPLLVLVGLGWWMVSVSVGRAVYDIREKRGWSSVETDESQLEGQ